LGDFNGDGSVNQFDLAQFIPHEGTAAGNGAFDSKFDLNADSRIDASDLALLMPRLYQPVGGAAPDPISNHLGSGGGGETGDGSQSCSHGHRPAAHAIHGAALRHMANSHWNPDADGDDALLAQRPRPGQALQRTGAVDSVMEGYHSPFALLPAHRHLG
jgi:hypothetical protein